MNIHDYLQSVLLAPGATENVVVVGVDVQGVPADVRSEQLPVQLKWTQNVWRYLDAKWRLN